MASDKYLTIDRTSFPYVLMQHKDIPLKTYDTGFLRCNIYLPKDAAPFGAKTYPVIATYGPYGKDVPYKIFFPKSWDQLNPAMKSVHAAWETPDPGYWTAQGYIVVRVDERGTGQSPGELDTMSRGTSEAFFDVVEWCTQQEWCSGKVGLLGISYYAGTQWRVAARKPKGLAAIIPWEGMSDYYRDRVRHGGILSDKFIKFWWDNAVDKNQYGKPGRAAKQWGLDTLDGDLDEATLLANRRDQTKDTASHRFLDDEYYASRDFNVQDIDVPLLSVGNWGGILLHLRGNVLGWMRASSPYKFLHFIVGRHDLPFYYDHSAKLQLSFFDAFLKNNDYDGWKAGAQPRVKLCIRKGDCGVDDPERELAFPTRGEADWPIPDTNYTKFFLGAGNELLQQPGDVRKAYRYDALAGEPVQFRYEATKTMEVTGHILTHLSVSSGYKNGKTPTDIDLFVTLRKLGRDGKEVFYTGTMGDPVPIVKGWQRVSLCKTDPEKSLPYLPYRNYAAADVQEVKVGQVYQVDVEVWPTSVVMEEGEVLVFEVAGHDTQGVGKFSHDHEEDRKPEVFDGINYVHAGGEDSWLLLPVIPERE